MRNVPAEVMAMPLLFLSHGEIVSLMLVSKRWQHVIRSTPSLWAALVLRVDADELGVLKKWLAYSGRLVISITLTIPLSHERALSGVCTMLGCSLHRVRHLGIHGERISYCSSITSLLHIPAPNLVSLDLSPTGILPNRALILPLRFDGVNGNTDVLLQQAAPMLQVLDLGQLNIPRLPQTAFASLKQLSLYHTNFNRSPSALRSAQYPVLETLIVKDLTMHQFDMRPWSGRHLRSIVIHNQNDLAVDIAWSFISRYDVTMICSRQRHDATYRSIMQALADGDWEITSLGMDYGLAVTATFRSGDRIRYLQSHDNCDRYSISSACEKLMYDPRCLSRIRDLTLGLALEPYNQVFTGHALPHLQMPALLTLAFICGAPHSEGKELPYTTLFDRTARRFSSLLRAPALKQILLIPRRASSSPFVQLYDGPHTAASTVSPSLLARFIEEKVECENLPELRVAEPDVRLLNDPTGLQTLHLFVSRILYTV